MKYEEYVRRICGESWKTVSESERQGGFGVACVMAYMRGVKPSLPELSKHLGVTPDEINVPFVRLLRNGVFNRDRWNTKSDPDLLGNTGDDNAERCWAFVAAVGGGFLGVPC